MRIAFLGDSLTEGRPGESFLTRLRTLLPGDELLNYGRAGDTIPDLLWRMEHTRLETVDLAFVWVGANDAFLGGWDLPPLRDAAVARLGEADATPLRATYDAILDLALRASTRVVCMPPVLPDPFEEGGFTRRVDEISTMIEGVVAARSGSAAFFDLRAAFSRAARADPHASFTIDGVHLAARGADVVADALAALIDSLRAA